MTTRKKLWARGLTLKWASRCMLEQEGKRNNGIVRIGDMAKQTGKSVAALRYYEQVGLLPAPERTEGGYRDYAPEMVERVRFISQAQARGFSLREITVVLAQHDRGQCPCGRVAGAARKKIARLDGRIQELRTRREVLAESVRRWENGLLEETPFCPILAASTNERKIEEKMARTIEVITAGCPLCDETLKFVQEAVSPCGCSVVARTADSPEAQQYGVTAVPTIVADGQVVHVGKPTREQAIALLRR